MNYDLDEALRHLPHGPEFRFLDRLTSLEPGQCGTGEYLIKGDESFLKGHFPGAPLLPGVILIEAAAQLAGVVAQNDPSVPPLRNLKLTAVSRVKFLGTAVPLQTVSLRAQITGRMTHLVQASVLATVGDRVIMQGDVALSGDPFG